MSNFCFYDPGPLQKQSQLTPKYHKSHWQRPRLSIFVESVEIYSMQKTWRLLCLCQRNSSGTETSKTSAHCILRCWNMCHCDHKMYHKDLAQFISPRESLQPLGMRWCDDATNMQGQTTQNRWIVTLDSRCSRCSVRRVKKCLPNDDWNWQLQFHEYNRTQSFTLGRHSNTY